MLKYIYKAIILTAVFVGALSYFSGDIKEVVFEDDNTTIMEEATYPLVTIKTDGQKINLIHGYRSNLAANKIRESVTPLNFDQTFEVLVECGDYNIKKLNYEVREFTGNALLETDSVSVFEEKGDTKTAKIKLKSELQEEKEYAVKITLITSESKKMYYYQRIKIYEEAHFTEKLNFIMEFHNAIFDKTTAENIIKYLEPSKDADNSSLAYVNINSSFDMVTWGDLQPTILTDAIPAVCEIYEDTASVKLSYIVEGEVNGALEKYRVTEFYRIRYSKDRMYLLNYERHMEAFFDITLASISENELKLGITSNCEIPYKAGMDETKLVFVRNRELWFYDMQKNELTKVFSFCQKNMDYERELYDQHDVRIVNMDAEGNVDFLVYGYMNRGQYEGKVAVILYRFIRAENRIEELVYIPVDEPYQSLKENMGELFYVNSKDVFYFHIYNNIYSYNMITGELSVIAKDVSKDNVVVLTDLNYAAWQETADVKFSENIIIMNLETGDQQMIKAEEGYNIRLLDMIDTNIIYGFVKEEDISARMDGSVLAPLSIVEIASVDNEILKRYQKEGYYISSLEVRNNVIELRRVQKVEEDGRTAYLFADMDYIMNQEKSEASFISVTSRVTEQALTEYYLDLPDGFVMEELPKELSTVSTIISQDPTVRLPDEELSYLYYAYVAGEIEGAYETAADAIGIADEEAGVVLNSNQQIIWERGVKETKKTITEFLDITCKVSLNDTVESCLKLILDYQDLKVPLKQLSTESSSAYDVLKAYSKYTPIRLTGAALDNVLYYVSKERPVIAMTDINAAVIIYGYDSYNIMVFDPSTGGKIKMGIQDSAELFEDAGNVFLSYLE